MPKINETIYSPNQSSRGNHIPRLIVLHICDGYYEGTKAWFAQSASQTSSHFVVARDGRICQCVPLDKMAWCNGTGAGNKAPSLSTIELVRDLGGNANQYSVSIECEGIWSETQGALTGAQLESVAWLISFIQAEIKRLYSHTILMDRRYIVGHCEITPKTRPHCPGEQFPWNTLMQRLGAEQSVQTLYRVQVGAFRLKSNAEDFMRDTVLPADVDAFLVQGFDSEENPLWRVQVGAFSVKTNALNYLAEVRKKGLDAFIVTTEG